MSGVLWLNDVDASTLGFNLTGAPELLSVSARSPRTAALPSRAGAWLGADTPRIAERVLRLTGDVNGDGLADGLALWDRVKSAVGSGFVEIRHAWASDRVMRGVLLAAPGGPGGRAWLGHLSAELEFLLADPYAYDRDPQLVGCGSTSVALPMGTAPSIGQRTWGAVVTVHGPSTTPTLTYSDAAGNVVSTMAFTFSPTSADALEIDIGRGLVTRIQNGVRDNGLPYLSAGWEFPRLDPADGDYYASAFPRLSVSSGAATIRYYRSWL